MPRRWPCGLRASSTHDGHAGCRDRDQCEQAQRATLQGHAGNGGPLDPRRDGQRIEFLLGEAHEAQVIDECACAWTEDAEQFLDGHRRVGPMVRRQRRDDEVDGSVREEQVLGRPSQHGDAVGQVGAREPAGCRASALPARSSRRTLSSDLFLAPAFGGPARPPHLMDPMEMANYQVSVW